MNPTMAADLPACEDRSRTPLRRPHSIRRTMSLDASWPDGPAGDVVFEGRARDLLTGADPAMPNPLAETSIRAIATNRTIRRIESRPARAELAELAGARAGASFRAAIDRALPEERRSGSPLYLLLDDLAGATLVASWTVNRWSPPETAPRSDEEAAARLQRIENICTGFRTGSSALADRGRARIQVATSPTVALQHPDDPLGWHALPAPDGMHFRRARWIDVWRCAESLIIAAQFQDSGTIPGGERRTVHEYHLDVTADTDERIRTIAARPLSSLPFPDCFAAPDTLQRLVGMKLGALRADVPVVLGRAAGCTHLNDALRALADVPCLEARQGALPLDPIKGEAFEIH